MSDDTKVLNKYEILKQVKDARDRGDDFLYLVGYPQDFPDMVHAIGFIRRELNTDVYLDNDTTIATMRVITIRWKT